MPLMPALFRSCHQALVHGLRISHYPDFLATACLRSDNLLVESRYNIRIAGNSHIAARPSTRCLMHPAGSDQARCALANVLMMDAILILDARTTPSLLRCRPAVVSRPPSGNAETPMDEACPMTRSDTADEHDRCAEREGRGGGGTARAMLDVSPLLLGFSGRIRWRGCSGFPASRQYSPAHIEATLPDNRRPRCAAGPPPSGISRAEPATTRRPKPAG